MNYFCYFNGQVLPKEQILVNITDLALVRGYGVFDFLRTYAGTPFRINDYLDRFYQSASEMNLEIPKAKEEIKHIVEVILSENKAGVGHEFGIRFLLTGGYSPDQYKIEHPQLFILAEDLPTYPAWQFEQGIRLHLWEHQRELPLVKTINYLTAIKLTETRHQMDVQDTLYHYNNKVLECTRNNFFLFHGDTLVTAGKNVLKGVSAKVVLELADKKFNIEVREILLGELDECTECFITGSTRGVCPVVSIDNKTIQKGEVGRHTRTIMELFAGLTNNIYKG